MLDFRKLFLALVVLALASVSAFAQNTPLSCVAQAAGTPSLRAEGVTEQVGDVLVFCNGGIPTPGNQVLNQVNIQVFTSPSINITSRQLASPATNTFPFTEALLFIDEPAPALQTICGSTVYPSSVPPGSGQSTIIGVCGAHSGTTGPVLGIGTYDPTVASGVVTIGTATFGTFRGNAYQARQSSTNSLIWQGIPFDPPGTASTRVIRLTNVRVNASQLGVPAGGQSSVALVVSTSASGVGNPIALPITNPAPTVGIAQNSLTFSVQTGGHTQNCLQCEDANKNFANNPASTLAAGATCGGQFLTLRYEELFPSVFRRRNQGAPPPAVNQTVLPALADQDVLGAIYQTETGFYRNTTNGTKWPSVNPDTTSLIAGGQAGTLGLADHGTRVIARFSNVQNGTQIWTELNPKIISNQAGGVQTGTAVLISTDPNGAGPDPFAAVAQGTTAFGQGGAAQVSIVGGTGQAVYEIVSTDTTAIERLNIQVVVAWVANTTNNLPALGTSSVNGNLAPISTVSTASTSAPIPRFIDTASNKTLLTINSCRTNLLFPFVTNQAGFDTGLAISNTSKDPFGTALQTGACTINYYGLVGTSAVTLAYPSPSITGGEHFLWSLANGGAVTATAGFQGYIIAQCNFQYGHGFAFVSDLGAQKLAMGYLALVMDAEWAGFPRTGSASEVLAH